MRGHPLRPAHRGRHLDCRRTGPPVRSAVVRFANSGTEATMDAVHLARSVTGRDLIIKVEGCYHGHHDSVEVSVLPEADEVGPRDHPNGVPGNSGIPAAIRVSGGRGAV